MVCKEEVLSWFKDLESYKRIDVLCELLNMCLPFELRFLGSCVEEIGKHTYQELRGPTITANDFEKLSKDVSFNQGLLEESVRHRVLIYISLLSSRNYSVANWLYKKLLRTELLEDFIVKGNVKDEQLKSEFLLLFTMALHHPAFTFDQKRYFSGILTHLIDFRENKNRVSPKPSAFGYPPGFGYPTHQKILNGPEALTVPVKTAPTISYGDPILHQQPPGLPHLPPQPAPHIDFPPNQWSRPGFPCGAPEVPPPFSAPPISPLVSQAASPCHSRSTSPLRAPVTIRPPPMMPPPSSVLDVINSAGVVQMPVPPPSLDPLTAQSSLPVFNSTADVKLAEEELNSIQEEKQLREKQWPAGPGLIIQPDMKQPNGIRFAAYSTKIRPSYLAEQMQAMSLDGENSLHHSNSSSNSSPTQTPPGTPSTPHGPGRGGAGDSKPRMNGIPPFAPAMCDATSPPPAPAFNNCSVPYTYPQTTFLPPQNRSLFHYNQTYRPTFTAPYHTFPTESSFSTYTFPYVPLMYSSPFPPRTPPSCYNCGAPGHLGPDCTAQNIEEITQKKAYHLDFASPVQDSDK